MKLGTRASRPLRADTIAVTTSTIAPGDAYLKNLPVHELKIDRSFVSSMTSNERDAVIVRSTVELGRNLGTGRPPQPRPLPSSLGQEPVTLRAGLTDDLVLLHVSNNAMPDARVVI